MAFDAIQKGAALSSSSAHVATQRSVVRSASISQSAPDLPAEIGADRAQHLRSADLERRRRSDGAARRVGRGSAALEHATFRLGGRQQQAAAGKRPHEDVEHEQILVNGVAPIGRYPAIVLQTIAAAAPSVTTAVAGWPRRTAATITSGKMKKASSGEPNEEVKKGPDSTAVAATASATSAMVSVARPLVPRRALQRREYRGPDDERAQRVAQPPLSPQFSIPHPWFDGGGAKHRDAD